jgi:hypothetical protein
MDLQIKSPGLQVLLVNTASTGDTRSKIQDFVKRQQVRWGQPFPFPILRGDTLLANLFPHQLLPHYVWLHNGIVTAITGSDALTKSNLQAFLSGRLALRQKTDLDAARPLFAAAALPTQGLQYYAICLRGYFPGYSTGNHLRRSGASVYGHAFTNCSLLYIYKQLAKQLIPGFTKKQWLLAATDSQELAGQQSSDLYNIDFIVPLAQAGSLYPNLLQFVNTATGWKGELLTRVQPVWVLAPLQSSTAQPRSAITDINSLPVDTAVTKPFSTVADWLTQLNNQPWISCPVVSDQDRNRSINLAVPRSMASVEGLNNTLAHAGWALSLHTRPVTMFRLTRQGLQQLAERTVDVKSNSSQIE